MTETEKEREDGVLGMSFFSRERSGTRQGGLVTTPQRKFEKALGPFFFNPFNSQDLVSISLYYLPYSSCDVSSKNLVLDQLIISYVIFYFILITCLLDIVLILWGEILSWSLMEV